MFNNSMTKEIYLKNEIYEATKIASAVNTEKIKEDTISSFTAENNYLNKTIQNNNVKESKADEKGQELSNNTVSTNVELESKISNTPNKIIKTK